MLIHQCDCCGAPVEEYIKVQMQVETPAFKYNYNKQKAETEVFAINHNNKEYCYECFRKLWMEGLTGE